jgi:hypothetical protein
VFRERPYGSEGFFARLDTDRNLEWEVHVEYSNPFTEIDVHGEEAPFSSTPGVSITVNLTAELPARHNLMLAVVGKQHGHLRPRDRYRRRPPTCQVRRSARHSACADPGGHRRRRDASRPLRVVLGSDAYRFRAPGPDRPLGRCRGPVPDRRPRRPGPPDQLTMVNHVQPMRYRAID